MKSTQKHGTINQRYVGIGDIIVQHEKSTSIHSELLKVDAINYYHLWGNSKSEEVFFIVYDGDKLNNRFDKDQDGNGCVYGEFVWELKVMGEKERMKRTLPDSAIQRIPCTYNNIFLKDSVQVHFAIEMGDHSGAFLVMKNLKQASAFFPYIGKRVELSIKMKYEKYPKEKGF